jgi:uncharacterized protein (TIGR03382 family)
VPPALPAPIGQFSIGKFADLGIEMTAPAKAGYGDTIEVNAKVTNLGPCAATKVAADDENGATAFSLKFEQATGDCDQDPLNGTCKWATLAVGESKSWTITYQVTGYPAGLMSSNNPVGITVFSTADDAFDPNADNDSASTTTYASRSQSGCNTGDMGGALSLLALALPFLRRRRKS